MSINRIIVSLISLLIATSGFAQNGQWGRLGSKQYRGGTLTSPIILPDGAVGIPSLTFSSGTDNGLYWIGTDQWSVSAGGTQVVQYYNAGTDETTQFIVSPGALLGAEGTPSLAFGDGNTGFWESSDNELHQTVAGLSGHIKYISNYGVVSIIGSTTGSAQIIFRDASATAPTYTFGNDEDTGVGCNSADQLSSIAGGAEIVRYVEAAADYVDHKVGTAYTPSSDQARLDDSVITIDNTIVRVVGDGGAVLLDTDPAVEDGVSDGQMVILQGTSDVNTVAVADAVNTALAGAATATLGQGDIVQLIWDAGDSVWYEVSRSDN